MATENEIIAAHDEWLKNIAYNMLRRMPHGLTTLDDLHQGARIGLLLAYRRFKELQTVTVPFTAYAMPRIRGEMLEVFRVRGSDERREHFNNIWYFEEVPEVPYFDPSWVYANSFLSTIFATLPVDSQKLFIDFVLGERLEDMAQSRGVTPSRLSQIIHTVKRKLMGLEK